MWTKLRAWCLDHDRVVLLDADMLVVGEMDALMTMPLPDGGIAACHTCRCNPEGNGDLPGRLGTRAMLVHLLERNPRAAAPTSTCISTPGSWCCAPTPTCSLPWSSGSPGSTWSAIPFPDQDLLNEYFRDRWAALPVGYNALKTLAVQHPDVWTGEPDAAGLRNIHYLLAKPWSKDGPPAEPVYAALDRFWHGVEARLDHPPR